MPENFEDLAGFELDPQTEDELLALQTECTFAWSTKDGSPMAVIMSFVFHDGRIWLTASSQRARVSAVRRNPRVAVVVSSTGTSLGHGKTVTFRGTCRVLEDEETKRWFYSALGRRRFPDDEAYRAEFVAKLDSPRRVILEVTPTERQTHDVAKVHTSAKMYGASE